MYILCSVGSSKALKKFLILLGFKFKIIVYLSKECKIGESLKI